MKYILLILIIFNSFKLNAQTLKSGIDISYSEQYLNWLIFYEMRDSSIKYIDLYNCSKRCSTYDSTRYYMGRAVYFINQSEYYCAIVYGVDSVKSKLYYKEGEKRKKEKECRCN